MYYPKSRIVTGLYTNGGEYKYKVNDEEYVGFYHKFYNGKVFTGKTQKNSPKFELVPLIGKLNSPDKLNIFDTDNKIALFLEDPDPIVNKEKWNQGMIVDYLKLQGLPTNEDNPRKVPTTFFPQPTKEDYEKAYILRYFAMKENEKNNFTEINKESYDKIKQQDPKWMWDQYRIFNVVWTISGETKEKIEEINRNILYLKQRKIKRNGLIAYLRGNYSKFFKSKAQLKLEMAPKSVKKKSSKNPIPNTEPVKPTLSTIRSEKFFKNQKQQQEERAAFETEKFNKNSKNQKSNQSQVLDNKKRNQQQGLEETESLEIGSAPPPTSPSNQQTSRNTGGY